jgi:hypothetical protein
VSFIIMGFGMARLKAYQDDKGYNAYRAGFSPNQSVCEQADLGIEAGTPDAASAKSVASLCKRAKSWYAGVIATGVIGGVGIAAGTVLILTSDTVRPKLKGKSSAWTLLPLASLDTAGALLHGAF